MSNLNDKLGFDPNDKRTFDPDLLPCTPEAARKIREEYGLLLPHETRPKRVLGPLRRPTLADYNALLEEDGKPPLSQEDYDRMYRPREQE